MHGSLLARLSASLLRGSLKLPRALGRSPATLEHPQTGAVLDRDTAAYFALLRASGMVKLDRMPLLQLRQSYRLSGFVMDVPPLPLAAVEDREIPGPGGYRVPVRVYTPEFNVGTLPILVYLHGGGFIMGDLDSHDGACRRLAKGARCVVVAVDYRLAPEHPFPAAVEDAYAAFHWIREHAAAFGGSPERVAIGGDSAGGNLSLVTSLRSRDAGMPMPILQLLIYPGADMTGSCPSRKLRELEFYLTPQTMERFTTSYVPRGHDLRDPEVSPLFAESMRGLPRTRIVLAGFDPLRDEGLRVRERLEREGVDVVLTEEGALIHGFLTMGGVLPNAAQALERVVVELQRGLAG